MTAEQSLGGKVVVVTGAAGGIGAAICAHLESLGVRTVGVDRRPSLADVSVELDLTDVDSYSSIVEAVGPRPLVGLVNNAAISSTAPSHRMDVQTWDEILAVNLRAPFFLSESLVTRLDEQSGSVVNISSVHAAATSAGAVPYAASKGGLLALTRGQAVDWSARRLRVRSNAVVPGAVDTNMLRDALDRTGIRIHDLAARHPSRRVGQPVDVAEAVSFLLSQRSSFVNGAAIVVDGGALSLLSTEASEG